MTDKSLRPYSSLLLILGLGLILAALLKHLTFGVPPMVIGGLVIDQGAEQLGTANLVTAVLLAYRGLDTLGEITILFAAASGAGLVLAQARRGRRHSAVARESGFILREGVRLLFPFLLLFGIYIILHGHLTPGGGFQGGAILAAAFFVPALGELALGEDERTLALIEGVAGMAFVLIGLAGLAFGGHFLVPLFGQGELGQLVSAGSLPLLSIAIGLKVGVELGGLVSHIVATQGEDA